MIPRAPSSAMDSIRAKQVVVARQEAGDVPFPTRERDLSHKVCAAVQIDEALDAMVTTIPLHRRNCIIVAGRKIFAGLAEGTTPVFDPVDVAPVLVELQTPGGRGGYEADSEGGDHGSWLHVEAKEDSLYN